MTTQRNVDAAVAAETVSRMAADELLQQQITDLAELLRAHEQAYHTNEAVLPCGVGGKPASYRAELDSSAMSFKFRRSELEINCMDEDEESK